MFGKLASKSQRFNELEIARYVEEEKIWQETKRQEKIKEILLAKKQERDEEVAREIARRIELQELEDEQRRLEEEQNSKKQKKDQKKELPDSKNVNSQSVQSIAQESAPVDEA